MRPYTNQQLTSLTVELESAQRLADVITHELLVAGKVIDQQCAAPALQELAGVFACPALAEVVDHCSAAEAGQVTLTLVGPRRSSMQMSASGIRAGVGRSREMKVGNFWGAPGLWARRRHLCTTLALMPCERATRATEAPGWAHSASTCCLNSAL